MYGLVNRGIEQLVRSRFGDAVWDEVCRAAGFEDDGFIAMESYDDSITYALVGAISETCDLDVATILEEFGEHWVVYTAQEGFGDLIAMCGNDVRSFLLNVNMLHEQVQSGFPALTPPHFELEESDPDHFTLVYRSERAGLGPMVVGLLRGIARTLGETIEIEHLPGDETTPDRFTIVRVPSSETTP